MYKPTSSIELRKLIKDDIPGYLMDVSNVIEMSFMFKKSQYNHPLDSWDTSKESCMIYMFSGSQYNHPFVLLNGQI